MKNYYKPAFYTLLALLLIGAVGDTFRSIMVDSNGLVQNDPISKTNNISIFTAPSTAHHLMRYTDVTNSATSFFRLPVALGGTGTNTTMLPGQVWTNSQTFVVGSNLVINSGQSSFSEQVKIYGLDGTIDLIPLSTTGHGRVGITYYTNNGATIAGWSLHQDPSAAQAHQFAIVDNINSANRILITSNTVIALTTLSTTVSSNMTVSGNLTVSVTNRAASFQVGNNAAFSGSITNFGVAYTNIEVFAGGILTNAFRTGP